MDLATAEAPSLWRRALVELIGTGALVAVVIGSGIAAARLSPADPGLRLLESSVATALGLTVLIIVLAPVSGAHFNPVVSVADWWLGRRRGGLAGLQLAPYVGAQLLGGVGGAVLANAMFEIPTTLATTDRISAGHLLGEVVATAGLVLVIFACIRSGRGPLVIGPAVGAYVGAAYWFTSSTSFANPAVTIGRLFSDTSAGIAPSSALQFAGAQLVGGVLGVLLVWTLFPSRPFPDTRSER